MTQNPPFSWNRIMGLRAECFAKFGNVLDIPIRAPMDVLPTLLFSGAAVLDIGAGAHKPFEKAITSAAAGYYSMDTDPQGTFDFQSFQDMTSDLLLDVILANQVIEHLTPEQAFEMAQAAFSHLKHGGVIMATVPNAAHPVRQRDFTHKTPWPANDLYSLLTFCGFAVSALYRYNKTPMTKNPIKRWIVETVCTEFRVDWCDSIMAVATKE